MIYDGGTLLSSEFSKPGKVKDRVLGVRSSNWLVYWTWKLLELVITAPINRRDTVVIFNDIETHP